jgi:hypothetical protein
VLCAPELRSLITVLVDAGVDGWALATWLTSASSWLSAGVPAELAARRSAACAAGRTTLRHRHAGKRRAA